MILQAMLRPEKLLHFLRPGRLVRFLFPTSFQPRHTATCNASVLIQPEAALRPLSRWVECCKTQSVVRARI